MKGQGKDSISVEWVPTVIFQSKFQNIDLLIDVFTSCAPGMPQLKDEDANSTHSLPTVLLRIK